MECSHQANTRLDGTGNNATNATLRSLLDDLSPYSQSTSKLRLDNKNTGSLAVENATCALQIIKSLVGCDWHRHCLLENAHSSQVRGFNRLLNVLYIKLSAVGENGNCLLNAPGLICIQPEADIWSDRLAYGCHTRDLSLMHFH